MTTNLPQFTAFQPAAAAETALLMKMLSARDLELRRLIDDELKSRNKTHFKSMLGILHCLCCDN